MDITTLRRSMLRGEAPIFSSPAPTLYTPPPPPQKVSKPRTIRRTKDKKVSEVSNGVGEIFHSTINKLYDTVDEEEGKKEKPRKIPWECPIDITSVEDIESSAIPDSFADPHSAPPDEEGREQVYEYVSEKAISNISEMIASCVAVMEEFSANS